MDHALPDVVRVHWPPGAPEPPADTEAAIERACAVLRRGGLVAIPTETVYGLAAVALDERAVERIYVAKGRTATNPLIVHVDGIPMARRLASEWPAAAERVAAACWPGPVTVVVPKSAEVPDRVTAGGPTVALRCPDHPIARRLITRLGLPLAAPSANRSLRLSPTTAAHVMEGLGAKVDLILDAGPCGRGIESTVVDCTVSPPLILRPGPLGAAALAAILGLDGVAEAGPDAAPAGVRRSPGRLKRHYCPRTPLEVSPAAADRVEALTREGRRVCWMTTAPAAERTRRIAAASPDTLVVPMPDEPEAYAALIYAMLHAADKRSLDRIVVDEPPDTPAWRGVRDRLFRAAAGAAEGDDGPDDAA
jgi:L-threonylcarbamoyladenylate synthase